MSLMPWPKDVNHPSLRQMKIGGGEEEEEEDEI